jgi:hypothetical protein
VCALMWPAPNPRAPGGIVPLQLRLMNPW